MRSEDNRIAVLRLVRQQPFQPFSLNMENGDRIIIEHPENIAFDPSGINGDPSSSRFSVISGSLFFIGNFAAVTTIALLDRGQTLPSSTRGTEQ